MQSVTSFQLNFVLVRVLRLILPEAAISKRLGKSSKTRQKSRFYSLLEITLRFEVNALLTFNYNLTPQINI